MIMRAFRAIAAILCVFAAYVPASAQVWPTAKPITIVVPVPPGPSIDMIARLVASKLSEAFGQAVIVDNRSGANGSIGSSLVAHAEPDGYTLLAATPASHVTAVHLMKSLPFDPVKDFTPIMAAVEPVTALVVNAELPVNSVQELIAYAKANPGKLSYGSSGVGSVFHLTGELFNRTAGVSMNSRSVSRRLATHAGRSRRAYPAAAHLAGERAGRLDVGQGEGPRHPGAQALRQAAGHSVHERDPSGLPQAVDLVRVLRPGEHAAGDRRSNSMSRCARRSRRPKHVRSSRGTI